MFRAISQNIASHTVTNIRRLSTLKVLGDWCKVCPNRLVAHRGNLGGHLMELHSFVSVGIILIVCACVWTVKSQ